MVALGFLLVNIGFMIAIPNFAAAVADLTSSVRRGMSFSVMQLVIGLASAAGPLLIGVLADLVGFNGAYGVMVLPLVLAVMLSFKARFGLRPRRRGRRGSWRPVPRSAEPVTDRAVATLGGRARTLPKGGSKAELAC